MMQIHVLGSAAGGGVPQWNCGCSNCQSARSGRLPRRLQASLAVSGDGDSWILLNATSDVRAQLERLPSRNSTTLRESPIEAVFLTDANLDHAAGLLDLRQAGALHVVSTQTVRDALAGSPVFAPFLSAPRYWQLFEDAPIEVAGLRVSAVPVPGLLPSYAGSRRTEGATIALDIEDGTGARLVYAPIYLEPSPRLVAAIDGAAVAFVDGSFWSDDEMRALGLGTRTAREMGHAPVSGPGSSLDALRSVRCASKYLTHINNSNPMLDPSSTCAQTLARAGFALAEDGMTIDVTGSAISAQRRA